MTREQLAEECIAFRKKYGLTQKELILLSHLALYTIRKIEMQEPYTLAPEEQQQILKTIAMVEENPEILMAMKLGGHQLRNYELPDVDGEPTLGRRLRDFRRKYEITQEQVADATLVQKYNISFLEHGKTNLAPDQQRRIEEYMIKETRKQEADRACVQQKQKPKKKKLSLAEVLQICQAEGISYAEYSVREQVERIRAEKKHEK